MLDILAEERNDELRSTLRHMGIRGNEIAGDLTRLGMGQPIVGISDAQIMEHFQRWEQENNKEA